MTYEKEKLIDVEKALKGKSKRKRKPSKLLVWFLKRIVHQDEMNAFLTENPDKTGFPFLEASLDMLNVSLSVKGEENIPSEGRFIFVSNHPLGGLDGMTFGHFLAKKYNSNVKFLSNDLLMSITPLQELFIPVNKHGSQGKHIANTLNDTFMSDTQVLIFPAGVCSRLQKGQVCDLEWKKTFITKAIDSKRDVIPVYFDARNSFFFYGLALIRKTLGIKLNIEMLFLADELFKQRNKTFKAYIGKPIPWQTFDKSKAQRTWAQEVKAIVYDLKKNP